MNSYECKNVRRVVILVVGVVHWSSAFRSDSMVRFWFVFLDTCNFVSVCGR